MRLDFVGTQFPIDKPANCVIFGWSGTGKTMLAQAIVNALPRYVECIHLTYKHMADIKHAEQVVFCDDGTCIDFIKFYCARRENSDIPVVMIIDEPATTGEDMKELVKLGNELNISFVFMVNKADPLFIIALEEVCEWTVCTGCDARTSQAIFGDAAGSVIELKQFIVKRPDGSKGVYRHTARYSKLEVFDHVIAAEF